MLSIPTTPVAANLRFGNIRTSAKYGEKMSERMKRLQPWRSWGAVRLGAAIALGLSLVVGGAALPNTLPEAQAAQPKVTFLSIRAEASSVKLGQQTVLRGVLGIKGTTQRLPNHTLRFFMRNAPTDGWTDLNPGKTYRTRSDGSYAFGFVPTRNVQVLVQYRGTASLAATSSGSAISVMIPVKPKIHEGMLSPESFAGTTGTNQAKNMDISLQRAESGRRVTKGQGKVNANGRYAFKVSVAPTASPSSYRLVLANAGRKTTYSNTVKAAVGQWINLVDMENLGTFHWSNRDTGMANINGTSFSYSIIANTGYSTYTGEHKFNLLGSCTRDTSAAGTIAGADPETRYQFGLKVNSVLRFGMTQHMGTYDSPVIFDYQFPKSTTQLGLVTNKTAGPGRTSSERSVWGDPRILCSVGFSQ